VKKVGLISIGVVAGSLGTTLIHWAIGQRTELNGNSHGGDPSIPHAEAPVVAETSAGATANTNVQNDALPAALKSPPSARPPLSVEEVLARTKAEHRNRDTQMLLSAGFTTDRIEWFLNRREELLAKQALDAEERRLKGLSDPYSGRYVASRDLDLRDDIGDAEYTTYVAALGRPTTVEVTSVVPGSNAETAGLRDGDEIVTYGGKRVYNYYDLQKTASESKARGNTVIEVRRNGQTIQLSMPAGEVGLPKPRFEDVVRGK
jgi:C-terminal processing protease CtpA/Prc